MSAVLSSPTHQSLPTNNPLFLFPSPTVDFITISGQIQAELLTFMGKTFILIQYKSYLGGWRVGAFPPPSQSVCLPLFPPPRAPSISVGQAVLCRVESVFAEAARGHCEAITIFSIALPPPVEHCHLTFPHLSAQKSLQVLKRLDPLFQTYSQGITQ